MTLLAEPEITAEIDDNLRALRAGSVAAFEAWTIAGRPRAFVSQLVYRRARAIGVQVSCRWTGRALLITRWP